MARTACTRPALAALALAGALAAGPGPAAAVSATHDDGPRLLSLSYGRQHPDGATSPFWGLRMPMRDPDGSIVSVEVGQERPRGPFDHMDGGCPRDGAPGAEATWFLPRHLPPGRYRFRITVYSATCDPADPHLEHRVFLRDLRVPGPHRKHGAPDR